MRIAKGLFVPQPGESDSDAINIYGLLNVYVSQAFGPSIRRNLTLLKPFWGTSAIDGAPALRIEPLGADPAIPAKTPKIDNAYHIGNDLLIERAQYKWSRWTSEMTGIRDMEDVCLRVRGDRYSAWAWPFRTFVATLRMMLTHQGGLLLHAAGYARDDGRSTLMLAPSGTGKTLTSLHWLCDGQPYYGDDLILYAKGRLHAMATQINFWPDRYRAANVLPSAFPRLMPDDAKRLSRNQWVRRLTAGQVGFGLRIDADRYWPGSVAAPQKADRLVVLHKAPTFCIDQTCDRKILRNRIIADLRYQSLPVLRWALCARLAQPGLWLSRWEEQVERQVDRMLDEMEVISIGVPSQYDKTVYDRLRKVIS